MEFEKLGEIVFNETSIVPFIQVKSTSTFLPIDFNKEEFSRYISITVMNMEKIANGFPNIKLFELRPCSKEDFKGSEDEYDVMS